MTRPLLCFLALCLLFVPLFGAQGAKREDRSVVRELDAFSPGAQADELPAAVDLRPFLPPVGLQTMNDCAAWAFGYAARSYLEAIDQGWASPGADTVFSPTFIYNQVNGGVDTGSRVDKVLELLMTKGAATLSTAPYLAKDFLSQPSDAAQAEAGIFRIASYFVVANGAEIRRALAEGHVVLCCVRTNPIFNSGRYKVYDAAKHQAAHATRRPDQPHGFHAMAIVGYSDDRQAFLFMNSWGKDWGDGGFVWVGYDALEQFNTGELTENLMDFALVMIDRREPVARKDGKWELVSMDSLEAHVFGGYAAYGEEGSEGAYRYTVSLRGSPEALGVVREVAWEVPTPDGVRTITTEDAAAGFRMTGRSESPTLVLTGNATTRDGVKVPVEARLDVPAAEKRSIRLERLDSSFTNAVGEPSWRWTLVPRMSDADWRDLTRIRYAVEQAGGPVDWVEYVHDGGLPDTWTTRSNAMPTRNSGEPMAGTATLEFRDGTSHVLDFPADPFTDKPRGEVTIEWDWRPEGDDGDRHWYFYELRVRYPEEWADNILGVRVGVGRGPSFRSLEAQPVSGPGPRMHVLHGYAQRPFPPRATVYFREPIPKLGMSTPATEYRMLEFDEAAAWTHPELAEGVLHEGHGFGIEVVDRYIGEVDGAPAWEVDVSVGGNANVSIVHEVTWELPSGDRTYGRWTDPDVRQIDGFRVTERTSGPFRMAVECKDYNGTTFRLERDVIPHAPRNDAIGVDVTILNVEELSQATPDQVLGEVSVLGLEAETSSLRRLRVWSQRSWGGMIPVQLWKWAYNEPIAIRASALPRVELARNAPSMFLLEFDDGSSAAVEARPHAHVSEPVPPRLQLLARERFSGWREHGPQYDVQLEVRGDLDVLQHLETVAWHGTQVGPLGELAPTPHATELRRARARTENEAEFSAALRFSAASGIEPITLRAQTLAVSERHANEPALFVERGYYRDLLAEAGPSADPLDFEPPYPPYRVSVVGADHELDEIALVRFETRMQWAIDAAERDGEPLPEPEVHTTSARDGLRGGFSWKKAIYEEWTLIVSTTLVMKNGEERSLPDVKAGFKAEDLYRFSQPVQPKLVRDWGMIGERRAALLLAAVPACPQTKHLVRGEFLFDRPLEAAGGSPSAAFGRGDLRREYLFFEPGRITGAQLVQREIYDMGFDVDHGFEREIYPYGYPTALTMPWVGKEPIIVIQSDPGPALRFIYLSAPENLIAQAERVTYELFWEGDSDSYEEDNGRSERYEVTDRIGEKSDRFELRNVGERPHRVVATLYGPDGPIEGGVIVR